MDGWILTTITLTNSNNALLMMVIAPKHAGAVLTF
jgi:hypothetical protein